MGADFCVPYPHDLDVIRPLGSGSKPRHLLWNSDGDLHRNLCCSKIWIGREISKRWNVLCSATKKIPPTAVSFLLESYSCLFSLNVSQLRVHIGMWRLPTGQKTISKWSAKQISYSIFSSAQRVRENLKKLRTYLFTGMNLSTRVVWSTNDENIFLFTFLTKLWRYTFYRNLNFDKNSDQ